MDTRCGLVAIVGRPNVGKSTLMNQALAKKLSITSPKAQTTRRRIQGVHTSDRHQIVFIDTPGFQHTPIKALGRYMNDEATRSLLDVDVVLWLVEQDRFTKGDQAVLHLLSEYKGKLIVTLNKSDGFSKDLLLAQAHRIRDALASVGAPCELLAIMPLSAKKGTGVEPLVALIQENLPPSPFFYQEDQLSNLGERFFLSEFLREQLVRLTSDELPYTTTVVVERIKEAPALVSLDAYIICERSSQKGIIIGKDGEALKRMCARARMSMESFLEKKVMLRVWVKAVGSWSESESELKVYGYED